MEIKPPANDLRIAVTPGVATAVQNTPPETTPSDLKIAQQINALITRITEKQLFLDIQGIKAHTIRPEINNLQTGDILKLQIEQLKPMLQFRILELQKNTSTNLITQQLKNIVSQETVLPSLMKNIQFIATRPALRPAPLSADVNAATREIYKHIPAPFNLKTGSQIKNQLLNSGLFIENKIKTQLFSAMKISPPQLSLAIKNQLNVKLDSVFEHDIGAQLYRLANLIKVQLNPAYNPALAPGKNVTQPDVQANSQTGNKATTQQAGNVPREQASLQNITVRDEAMQTFLRQVESSLTQLQQTQLQNLNEAQSGRPLWLMELPIKNGQDIDVFKLKISEEETAKAEHEAKKIWNVTLQFDLSGLGKVKTHITMQNDMISAQFYSEKPETLTLFRQNFDFLRNRLNYNGLNVGNIECAQQTLTEETAPTNIARLDERT